MIENVGSIVLGVNAALLLSLAASSPLSAQGEPWCADCDPGGSGCTIVPGAGFYRCENEGGGDCLLSEPGCGIKPDFAELRLDGTIYVSGLSLAAGSAGGDALTVREYAEHGVVQDGRTYVRKRCNGWIVGRMYDPAVAAEMRESVFVMTL